MTPTSPTAMIHIESPWGRLGIFERDDHIVALGWQTDDGMVDNLLAKAPYTDAVSLSDHASNGVSGNRVLDEAVRQLRAYIDGSLTQFDLPLAPEGGEFQQRVCEQMLAIPFGETRTYGELASRLGSMPQPVGQACGNNSIGIIIPCHRVLGANGIGGFSAVGGIETKISLLQHENGFPYLL